MPTTVSDNLVLLDTSVWIDYLRKKRPLYERVEELIDDNRICTLRFIVAEILQGASSKENFSVLKEMASVFPLLEEEPDTWTKAAELAFELRAAGKQVGLGDCYIAIFAHQYKVPLWSLNRHFKMIASHIKLDLYFS